MQVASECSQTNKKFYAKVGRKLRNRKPFSPHHKFDTCLLVFLCIFFFGITCRPVCIRIYVWHCIVILPPASSDSSTFSVNEKKRTISGFAFVNLFSLCYIYLHFGVFALFAVRSATPPLLPARMDGGRLMYSVARECVNYAINYHFIDTFKCTTRLCHWLQCNTAELYRPRVTSI